MEPGAILAAARDGLADMAERYAGLVEQLADTSVPIPGSAWTVRDAAAHLAGSSRRYAGLVRNEFDVSALPLDKAFLDARARSLIADNPETDPKKLAVQIREGVEDFLKATATRPAVHPIAWYAGLRPHVAGIVAIYLGEPLLHGYDVANAVGVPWPIDPEYAALALGGYRLIYPAIFHPRLPQDWKRSTASTSPAPSRSPPASPTAPTRTSLALRASTASSPPTR